MHPVQYSYPNNLMRIPIIPHYKQNRFQISNNNYHEYRENEWCYKFGTKQDCGWKRPVPLPYFPWVTYEEYCKEVPTSEKYGCRKRRIRNIKAFVNLDFPSSTAHTLSEPELVQCIGNSNHLNAAGQKFEQMLQGMKVISDEALMQAGIAARDLYQNTVAGCMPEKYKSFWQTGGVNVGWEPTVVNDWEEVG